MTDEQSPGEVEWNLVMPFVVCQPEGPYDSTAFVAGARFGQDSAELQIKDPDQWEAYVYPEMVPQYDLLAMHHGYQMTAEPWEEHPDEWVLVSFKRPADPARGRRG